MLETFPAEGVSDLPRGVVTPLRYKLYLDVSLSKLKQAIDIGRLHGSRSRIVHVCPDFLCDIDFAFKRQLRKLRVVVDTCLRLLAGLPAGSGLDAYVRVETENAA